MRFKGIDLNLKRLWSYATLVREFNTKPIKLNGLTLRYVITHQTARADLLGLEKLGYLHKHLRGRQFIFLLDKEKCMNVMNTSEKKQIILSDFETKNPTQPHEIIATSINNQN